MSQDPIGAVIAAAGVVLFIAIAIGVVVSILFIVTLSKALSRCAPHNRATSPGSCWLLLIPLVGIVWCFMLFPRISESLWREFRERNLPIEPQPGRTLGLVLASLQACGFVPFVNLLAAPAALICWILYWVKISGYSSQLGAPVDAASRFSQSPWPTSPAPGPTGQAGFLPQPQPQACACGASLRPGARFCASCGRTVGTM
jgi:hypothetical protein